MDNFYVLLELPIDPPASDPGQIRAALGRKKQEWTRQLDHPGKRTQAMANLASLQEIEQVMFDPAARKKEALAAATLMAEMMRRFEAELRILEGKGYLMPREASAIAAKYKVYGVTQQKVREKAKVPISEHPPEPPPSEAPGEVLDRLTAKAIGRSLALLDKSDLYAFLGEPPYSSIKKLREAAELRRRAAAATGTKSAETVAAQELAGICLRMFESFDTKQKYDRYLKISAYPGLGEMIDDEFTRHRHISPSALLRLVNFGVEAYGCKVLEAEDHIRRYCDAYRIPVGAEKPLVICPACKEQVERDSVVCQYCAAPLQGDCPNCGTHFEGGQAACSACGFLLCDMVKALPYLDDAQGAIIDGSWSTAQRCLQYVEKYWPGHPEALPLKKRARDLEERYIRYADQVQDCVQKNQYYAALELIEEANGKNARLPEATVRQINRVVEDLEAQLQELATAPQPDIQRLLDLSADVADSIELTRMLAKYPPGPPATLTAKMEGRCVQLAWSAGDSPGRIEYVVIRKRDVTPYTPFDGDILYEGPANTYTDRTADALVDYYYCVFTKRGNTYSKNGTVHGPLMLIPEIEHLRILPADQGAQLSWTVNPDIREVLIWRKLGGERPTAPGDGILLETSRIDGFMDTKIKNDVDYWYYLTAVYAIDGRRVQSHGVCEMITPHKILAPVERLNFTKSEYGENEYVVNWYNAELTDLILLASPKKPAFKTGDVFPVQELLSTYRSLSMHARTADSGRFRYSFTGGAYIFAAVLFGRFAAVGQPHYLTNYRDVEQPTADLIGNELYLNMKWPLGLGEIAVVWKKDGYPASIDEIGTQALYVSREQYDYDAGVILRDAQPGTYFFKIFGIYTGPEGDKSVSEGVTLLFKHLPRQEVFYRFSYRKKALKKQAEFVLTLSGPGSFALPPAMIVSQTGRLPLGRTDGEPLFELDDEIKVSGEVILQYQLDPLPEETHLRLFLAEDKDYERFRLLPGSSLKVT